MNSNNFFPVCNVLLRRNRKWVQKKYARRICGNIKQTGKIRIIHGIIMMRREIYYYFFIILYFSVIHYMIFFDTRIGRRKAYSISYQFEKPLY